MDRSQHVVAVLAPFLSQVKSLSLALPNLVTGAESLSIVIVSGLMHISYMLTKIIFTFGLWDNRGNTLRWKHKICTSCSVLKISFSV